MTFSLTDRTEDVTLPYGIGETSESADFAVRLGGPGSSRVTVDPRYDAFAPLRMVINRGYRVPETDERVPFRAVETGRLRYGNGNPESPVYDSLADVPVSPSTDAIEVRIPWLLLNVSDPSRRRRLGDFWTDGLDAHEPFDAIDVAAASYVPADDDGNAAALGASTNLTHAVPAVDGERLKESADHVRRVFDRYA